MYNNNALYELQVRPNGRKAADEYNHNGQVWIEGREGSRYDIFFRNNSNQRVMAIISVDGLDVISGKPAGSSSPGYVVEARSSLTIPGWKLTNQEAAEFYFSRKNSSYVTQIGGNVGNTGVIGAMVFRELYIQPIQIAHQYQFGIPVDSRKTWHMPTSTPVLSNASLSAPGSVKSIGAGIDRSAQLGTGFGAAVNFATTKTQFLKADPNNPDATMVFYYNTAEQLKKMGIVLKTRHTDTRTPQAFPADSSGNDVACIPPPKWVK